MDDADKRLCDQIQNEFPLVARPYAAVGESLGMTEDEVLERVTRLRGERIIRQLSGIFDTRRLGYQSSLVAARTSPERADAAAEVINSHPGVTHNYERHHEFNIWFTIGVPPTSQLGLDRTIELLGELAQVDAIRPLPALKFFKIGVDLDMKGGRDPAAKKVRRPARAPAQVDPLSEAEIAAIRALQADLRALPEPFAAPAERIGSHRRRAAGAGRRASSSPARCAASRPSSTTARPGSCTTAWASGRCPTSGSRRWAR